MGNDMNILIVEDDQQLAEQLVASLKDNGHETVHVGDGDRRDRFCPWS